MKAVGTVRIHSGWSLMNSFVSPLGEKFDVTDEKEKVKMSHKCGLGEWAHKDWEQRSMSRFWHIPGRKLGV